MNGNTNVQQAARDALTFTSEILDQCGPRVVGDQSTHRAAHIIKERWANFADRTEEEPFTVHPKAFLGWIRILVVFYFISLISAWFNFPLAGAVLMTLGLILMVLQFFYYKEIVDPFYKKKVGINVTASIEPLGEVKQQVIVSGHHDSAYVYNLLYKLPKLYNLIINAGIGTVALTCIVSWVWTIYQWTGGITTTQLGWRIWTITMTVLFVVVGQLFFFAKNKGTPGAGDNMIATAIADQVGMMVVDDRKKGNGLKHTRVIIGSWDGEEAGLRGARAYCKKHGEEMKALPTFVYNMDCIYNLKHFFFMTSDVNLTVKLSETMAEDCVKIAADLGYKSKTAPIAFLSGGTDAGEFGRIGVEATTLMGMPWDAAEREIIYHTPNDTLDKIEPQAVEAAIAIGYEYIRMKDGQSY